MTKLELVGEHWKDNLLGLTMTRELGLKIQEKYAQELALIRAEMRLKELKEGKRRTRQNLNDVVTVSILDKKNRILDIGFNDPKDLMLDSMGKFLADLLFSTPSGVAQQTGDYSKTPQTLLKPFKCMVRTIMACLMEEAQTLLLLG